MKALKLRVVMRLLAGLVAGLFTCAAWAATQVEVFTPQGQAKGVRQVAVRFSEPMVAFGEPRLADPFTVRCEGDAERLKGRGRWADSKNWVYDFAADLPAGQRCQFTLERGSQVGGRRALEGQKELRFHTGGPARMTSLPREGDEGIDEEQVFLLALDAPADPASFKDAWCEASGINERIPLKLLPEKETRDLLAANRYGAYDLFARYLKGRSMVPIARFKVEDKRLPSCRSWPCAARGGCPPGPR